MSGQIGQYKRLSKYPGWMVGWVGVKKQGICAQNDQLDGWMSGQIGQYKHMSKNPGWMVG